MMFILWILDISVNRGCVCHWWRWLTIGVIDSSQWGSTAFSLSKFDCNIIHICICSILPIVSSKDGRGTLVYGSADGGREMYLKFSFFELKVFDCFVFEVIMMMLISLVEWRFFFWKCINGLFNKQYSNRLLQINWISK